MGILARGTTKHAHVCMKRDGARHLAFHEGSLGVLDRSGRCTRENETNLRRLSRVEKAKAKASDTCACFRWMWVGVGGAMCLHDTVCLFARNDVTGQCADGSISTVPGRARTYLLVGVSS